MTAGEIFIVFDRKINMYFEVAYFMNLLKDVSKISHLRCKQCHWNTLPVFLKINCVEGFFNFDYDVYQGVTGGTNIGSCWGNIRGMINLNRSEEHTSELQSRLHL